jgi:fumarate reductase flavoprotein subunit
VSDGRFDLIAMGGGLAGLSAALRALELGGRALVLEASDEPRHLCASRVNGGILHVAFRSVRSDLATLADAVGQATHGFVESRLARALADHAGRATTWLAANGAEFTRIDPDDGWKDRILAPSGFYSSNGFAWKDLGPDRLLVQMEQRIERRSGAIVRGARASELVMRGGACVGVKVADRVFEGRAVVLADGGFHGNPDMLRRFVTPNPQSLKLRGPPSAFGDGIRFAEAAGAKLVGMEAFYGHLLSADSLVRDGLCPFPFLDLLATAGMIVDDAGTRFVDEARGPHVIANALARHRTGIATVIFDETMWTSAGRDFFCPPNPHLIEAGGTLHKADDLPALARLAGLPQSALSEAAATRDVGRSAMARSLDATRARHGAMPFGDGPYYAAPACAAITHTMGGVAVDEHARVLDTHDQPIRGLYAAGATCGGLEGGPDAAYLGGLVPAAVFGMLAAEHAVGPGS